MIAGGITFQICKNCGTSFFGGGAGHGKIKKRAGARFCTRSSRAAVVAFLRDTHVDDTAGVGEADVESFASFDPDIQWREALL